VRRWDAPAPQTEANVLRLYTEQQSARRRPPFMPVTTHDPLTPPRMDKWPQGPAQHQPL
jgi:hypothetical protein